MRTAASLTPLRVRAARVAIPLIVLLVAASGIWLINKTTAADVTTTRDASLDQTVPVLGAPADAAAPVVAAQPASAPAQITAPTQPAAESNPDPLAVWAAKVARVTGIPTRALVAYGNADVKEHASQPGCQLSWATLAGIGHAESNHGQYGGAVLLPNGYPSKPIIGVPLDGSPGVGAIPASDGGHFDGDPVWEHALGPMQFLPSTWQKYGGGYDPQQIDAAALAAARYLCTGGRDMASATGWWTGILSYNNSMSYAQTVFRYTNSYATAANQLRGS